MDFTKNHNVYSQNRFFMQGDPAAMLMVEFWGIAKEEVEQKAAALIEEEEHAARPQPSDRSGK